MSSSKQREKIFHDIAFSDNTRSVTDKYYSIFSIVQKYYNKKLFEAAIGGKSVLEIGCGQGDVYKRQILRLKPKIVDSNLLN